MNFTHTNRDPWRWTQADIPDIDLIVQMAQQHFESEIDQIFTPNPDSQPYS